MSTTKATAANGPRPVGSGITLKGLIVASAVGAASVGLCYGLAVAAGSPSVKPNLCPYSAVTVAALIAFAINWSVWIPSAALKTEHFYDLTGAMTSLSVVAVTVAYAVFINGVELTAWRIIPAVAVGVWALRLGSFLFIRIMNSPHGDTRFDKLKVNPVRFFIPWTIQAVWVFCNCLPMVVQVGSFHALRPEDAKRLADGDVPVSPGSGPGDLSRMISSRSFWEGHDSQFSGLAFWVIGFLLEVVADWQKSRFRANPANKGRFITSGVWAWSRHPNYFGEMMLWVGLFTMGLGGYQGGEYLTVVAPVMTGILLMFVSGIPLLEKAADDKWGKDPAYQAYKANVHVLIPFAGMLTS